MTLMLAGASVIFCSKPAALTTVSLSVTGAFWARAVQLQPIMAQDRAVRAKGIDMRAPCSRLVGARMIIIRKREFTIYCIKFAFVMSNRSPALAWRGLAICNRIFKSGPNGQFRSWHLNFDDAVGVDRHLASACLDLRYRC